MTSYNSIKSNGNLTVNYLLVDGILLFDYPSVNKTKDDNMDGPGDNVF